MKPNVLVEIKNHINEILPVLRGEIEQVKTHIEWARQLVEENGWHSRGEYHEPGGVPFGYKHPEDAPKYRASWINNDLEQWNRNTIDKLLALLAEHPSDAAAVQQLFRELNGMQPTDKRYLNVADRLVAVLEGIIAQAANRGTRNKGQQFSKIHALKELWPWRRGIIPMATVVPHVAPIIKMSEETLRKLLHPNDKQANDRSRNQVHKNQFVEVMQTKGFLR